MKRFGKLLLLVLGIRYAAVAFAVGNGHHEVTVCRYQRYEISLSGPSAGNPFQEVSLTASFWLDGGDTLAVRGFYDGDGRYKIRFMPRTPGDWHYQTHSNITKLSHVRGTFRCTDAKTCHGMVKTAGRAFVYQDGTPYYPVGTTAYAWVHMSKDLQDETVRSLAKAQFNKVRMCVFPKHYSLCKELPEAYPFVLKKHEGDRYEFDFTRPNPLFYENLERRIDQLAAIGCEADLILFHPYDKGYWGFDQMTMEQNRFYLSYLQARLSSFHNLWWSMANEFDYVKGKTLADWDALIDEVRQNDPYGHLLSVHGSTATYYNYMDERISHTSIQDEGPVIETGRSSILRSIYPKPVVFDEVAYEGNPKSRWGRLSGQEMLYRMWNGLAGGTYVTHGECYQYHEGDYDTIFWAKGGPWRGESWKRIPFMRSILADLPHPLMMADVSRDELTSTAGDGYYLLYLGKSVHDYWLFNLPAKNGDYARPAKGDRYSVEIIDTWNMTIQQVDTIYELSDQNDYRYYDKDLKKVWLPLQPYLLLRIKKV